MENRNERDQGLAYRGFADSHAGLRIPAKLNSHSGQREHPDP